MLKLIFLLPSFLLLAQLELLSNQSIQETKDLIQEWVKVETLQSEEQKEGQLKIQLLKNSNDVLKKELELLTSTLEQQKSQLSQSDLEREKWIKKEKTLSTRRDLIEKTLLSLEPKVLQLKKKLPPLLVNNLASNFRKLEEKHQKNDAHLGERAQLLISLLLAIQDFDKKIHLGYEVLKDSSQEEIEVKVLYIGLSTAYYCSNNDSLSGYGHVNQGQWKWQNQPELLQSIKSAFKIYESEIEDARFISLPVGDAS